MIQTKIITYCGTVLAEFKRRYKGCKAAQQKLQISDDDREYGQNLACLIIQLQAAKKLRLTKPEISETAIDNATKLAKTCLQQIRERASRHS